MTLKINYKINITKLAKSSFALRLCLFLYQIMYYQSSKRVCVKEESASSNILRTILFQVISRVCLLSLNMLKTSIQYLNGNYKILAQMAQCQMESGDTTNCHCSKHYLVGIIEIYGYCFMPRLSEFQTVRSGLIYLLIFNRAERFLKQL